MTEKLKIESPHNIPSKSFQSYFAYEYFPSWVLKIIRLNISSKSEEANFEQHKSDEQEHPSSFYISYFVDRSASIVSHRVLKHL